MAEQLVGGFSMALILVMIGLGPNHSTHRASGHDSEEHKLPGMEFALGAAAAKAARVPLILARDFIAAATAEVSPPLSALQLRASRVVNSVLVALDTLDNPGRSKYKSLAAVVHEDHLPGVIEQLSSSSSGFLAEETEVQSGRPTLRFRRTATGQRLLLVAAASHDEGMDAGLPQLQAAIERSDPDLVLLDMSEDLWRERREEFAVWTGHDLRVDADRLGSSTSTEV